jgi:succinyl-CoA synthetase alpha subunit
VAILLDERTRILVQGITGRHGRIHARLMAEYGTTVAAGVTPGKGGSEVAGVPVFDTVAGAVKATASNTSVILVPPAFTLDAALEAIEAGIGLVVAITEHVPALDTLTMREAALEHGATLVGPNTVGVICPGISKAGIMPGHLYRPGHVGLISRSGTLTHEIASTLSARGIGQSTCIGIGGDAVTGLDMAGALQLFQGDPDTVAVVLVGEIGGTAEEEAADLIARGYPKPVAAFLAGWSAPPDQRMGHAGAIIRKGRGTVQEKAAALRRASVPVAEDVGDLADLVESHLARALPG